MKKLIIFSFLFTQLTAKGQFLDSLKVNIGTTASLASEDYLPLWLFSNRFGTVSDQKQDLSTHLRINNSHSIDSVFGVDYSIDVYNNTHFNKNIIQEAYIRGRYKDIQITAGRLKHIIGEVDHEISSGSLGVSGNALPIPKVSFSIPNYIDLPFTNSFAQFKGQISHGWMGRNRYMKDAIYHEKNLYVKLGKKKFRVYGGIQHYAMWGGNRKQDGFNLDKSFKGFLNVLFALEANDGSVPDSILPNRAGDHRGIIEFGAEWENDRMKIQLNNQTPFEMGQGMTPKNIDRLLSLSYLSKVTDTRLKKIVIEFLYTKQMNSFYPMKYRESYYNNGVYKTGWEYENNIIGTPIFINRNRASKYFSDIHTYDWNGKRHSIGMDNIINNRVIGLHIGSTIAISKQALSKTMITYTENFGNYDLSKFAPSKSQFYSLQEINWILPKSQLVLTCSLGYDWGELSNNFGTIFGIQWHMKNLH